MRDLLILAIIAMSMVMLFSRPFIGVLVWCWMSYLNPQKQAYGFASQFAFLDFVASGTFIAWLVSREPKKIPNHPVVVIMVAYFFWCIVSTVLSVSPEISTEKLTSFTKIIAFGLFTIVLVTTKRRLMFLIYTMVLSLGYFGLKGGMFTLLGGGGARVYGPTGTMLGDNNNLALAMSMILPLLYFLWRHAEYQFMRWAALGMGMATVVGILGTGSRGGLIALGAAAFWLIVQSRARIPALIGTAVVAVMAFQFMPKEWLTRMELIGSAGEDGSFISRMQMWRYALQVANHDPLTGGGFSLFRKPEYAVLFVPPEIWLRASHSIYFEVLGEHGYVGLFLFILLLTTGFVTAWQTKKLVKNTPELQWAGDLSSMLQASLVAYGIGGAALELASFDFFYHLAGMAAITQLLVIKHLRETGVIPEVEKGFRTTRRPLGGLVGAKILGRAPRPGAS